MLKITNKNNSLINGGLSNRDLLKLVLVNRRFFWIRFLILLGMASSLITLIYNSIPFSCQLSLVQNLLIPFLVTSILLSKISVSSRIKRIRIGVYSGLLVGTLIALSFLIVSNVHYQFLGGREIAYAAREQTITPMSPFQFMTGILTQLIILVELIIMSILSCLVASTLNPFNKSSD